MTITINKLLKETLNRYNIDCEVGDELRIISNNIIKNDVFTHMFKRKGSGIYYYCRFYNNKRYRISLKTKCEDTAKRLVSFLDNKLDGCGYL